jgi:hypothetical protein
MLSVSHLRMGPAQTGTAHRAFLWRWIRLSSLTGNWWQLTPSVFLKSQADANGNTAAESAFFACPACSTPLEDTPPLLHCTKCGAQFPVIDGIYDMRLNAPNGAD